MEAAVRTHEAAESETVSLSVLRPRHPALSTGGNGPSTRASRTRKRPVRLLPSGQSDMDQEALVPEMPGPFSVVAMEVLSISCPRPGRQNCCRFQTLDFCFSRCQAGRSRPYVQNPALTLQTLPPRAPMDLVRLGYPENMTSFNFVSLSTHTHTHTHTHMHTLVLVMVTHCWVQSDFNLATDCIWPCLTWLPCDIV